MKIFKKFMALLVRHKYATTLIIFAALIGYFDTNSLYDRYQLYQEQQTLETEIERYTDSYNRDTKLYNELQADHNAVVRIAREKFNMKHENEDVYVFEYEEAE